MSEQLFSLTLQCDPTLGYPGFTLEFPPLPKDEVQSLLWDRGVLDLPAVEYYDQSGDYLGTRYGHSVSLRGLSWSLAPAVVERTPYWGVRQGTGEPKVFRTKKKALAYALDPHHGGQVLSLERLVGIFPTLPIWTELPRLRAE